MHHTRIKICGICRPPDAELAALAGADAIGLVFHPPAPRCVSMDRARDIVAALPPFVTPVGLFVDADPQAIRDTAAELGLGQVQLHGHETPEQVAALAPLRVIKALRVDPERFGDELRTWREAIGSLMLMNLKGLVLETAGTKMAGGTGVANDWKTIARHQRAGGFDGLPAVIAAGGLDPDSVGAVVRALRPWAVDVSSGVEQILGEKSPQKVHAFIDAVCQADAG